MNVNHEPHEAFMKRMSKEMDAKSRQVDGDHYQLPIQPIDFIVIQYTI